MAKINRRSLDGLIVCAAVALLGAPAQAAGTSPWVQDSYSDFRLIAGADAAGSAALRAGIEIKLKPGWHTYWRYPGDSGVPPRFSFSGSQNVATVKVLYPAPTAIVDETGTTIGYTGNVIFPLRVFPRQPGKPVTLRLKIDYAVCEKLCVPAEGRAELTLDGSGDDESAALAAAEARVPKPVTAAEAGLTAKIASDDKIKPLVYVDLATPADKPVQLFVEGPTADWALPIPKPAQGAPPGHQHFGFVLDGLPPGVDPRAPYELTFTIVQGDRATEVKTHLD